MGEASGGGALRKTPQAAGAPPTDGYRFNTTKSATNDTNLPEGALSLVRGRVSGGEGRTLLQKMRCTSVCHAIKEWTLPQEISVVNMD